MSPEELIPSRFAEHACAVDQAWLIRDTPQFSSRTVTLIEEVVSVVKKADAAVRAKTSIVELFRS